MLPRAVATTTGVQLVTVDIIPDGKTSPAAGSTGVASVTWDPVDPGYMWLIQRMSTITTSTTPTQLAVYAGTRLIDGSSAGNFDFSADNGGGAAIVAGEQLSATWYGLSPGATATLQIQYALVARESS